MADRKTLHKTKLGAFKEYLDYNMIPYRPGKGDYQVLQVQIEARWQVIHERLDMPEHFTIPEKLVPTVFAFIRSERSNSKLKETTNKHRKQFAKQLKELVDEGVITWTMNTGDIIDALDDALPDLDKQ